MREFDECKHFVKILKNELMSYSIYSNEQKGDNAVTQCANIIFFAM